VGYDAHGARLRVANSWTAAWGDNGLWWMDPEYLTWSETSDLWTVDGWRRIADRHAELESEVTS
jgi:C1A family cysteine protease